MRPISAAAGYRVEVVPGQGVVLRFGQLCIWAGLDASDALLNFLSQSARNLAPSGRGGVLLADHVEGVLEQGDPEPASAFVTLGPDGEGSYIAVLHGSVRVWTGVGWIEPPVFPGWQRMVIAPAPMMLAGGAGSQPQPGGSHPIFDLESGTVPGGGFALIDAGGSLPAPAAELADGPVAAGEAVTAALESSSLAPTTAIPGGPPPLARPEADAEDVVAVAFASPDRSGPVPLVRPADVPTPRVGVPGEEPTDPGIRPDSSVGAHSDATWYEAPTSVMPIASPDLTVALPPSIEGGQSIVGSGRDPARPPGVIGLLPPPGGLLPGPPAGPVGSVPVVRGVRCSRGHFNHPSSPACIRCSEALDRERLLVSGPRPSLGVLVVDDGSLYALDRPYLVGSGASEDPAVTGGNARPLVLAGDRVAAIHAEIRVTDWTVAVVDRASTGSTHLLLPGSDGWSLLAPFRPSPLLPGTHIAIGARVMTFVSPWPS